MEGPWRGLRRSHDVLQFSRLPRPDDVIFAAERPFHVGCALPRLHELYLDYSGDICSI
jgi:hypothetical protein